MDLSKFDELAKEQEKGTDVEITHPASGDKLGITIRVAGPDSDRARRAKAATFNRQVTRRKVKVSGDELEEEEAISVAALTISWEGVEADGKPLECNEQNALMVYRRFPFIRRQVNSAAGDLGSFMKG